MYVAELGFQRLKPGSAITCITEYAMEPGLQLLFVCVEVL